MTLPVRKVHTGSASTVVWVRSALCTGGMLTFDLVPCTNVSGNQRLRIFRRLRRSLFLQNVGGHVPNYTASHHKRLI